MLNITMESERDATECDRCPDKDSAGCMIGNTSTEVLACRVEHSHSRWKPLPESYKENENE